MIVLRRALQLLVILCFALPAAGVLVAQESPPAKKPFEPVVGQSGKDVVQLTQPPLHAVPELIIEVSELGVDVGARAVDEVESLAS